MKNIKTMAAAALLTISGALYAQEPQVIEAKPEKPYNRWSVEVNAGPNKAVKPFAAGYYSSDGSKFYNFSKINHFDIGARYMFSTKFGLKLDFASDNVANQKATGSLPFEVQQYRIGLQGVANMGRILGFEDFTGRFGLLAHAGIQVSNLTPKMGANTDKRERDGGIIIGLAPQFRITRRLVLTGDFTLLSNVRQHYNWDGTQSAKENNLTGQMYNTSLGLTWYFGKKKQHADWYITHDSVTADAETKKRLAEIEAMLYDTDRDGVPDYLDAQNNTPPGLTVDTKGRFIDLNKNGTPDELESQRDGKDGRDSRGKDAAAAGHQSEAMSEFIEKGYLNIFYDVNEDEPNKGATANVFAIIRYMKEHPQSKAKLTGFADLRGEEASNLDLSKRRAQKLFAILKDTGISPSRISIQGQGTDSSFPTTKTGYDLARRVSVSLE